MIAIVSPDQWDLLWNMVPPDMRVGVDLKNGDHAMLVPQVGAPAILAVTLQDQPAIGFEECKKCLEPWVREYEQRRLDRLAKIREVYESSRCRRIRLPLLLGSLQQVYAECWHGKKQPTKIFAAANTLGRVIARMVEIGRPASLKFNGADVTYASWMPEGEVFFFTAEADTRFSSVLQIEEST